MPKPIINKGGCNLSFAGLKTAILRIVKNIKSDKEKFDLAASFQRTIEDILFTKTKVALDEFKELNSMSKGSFVVAGGVAANKGLRKKLIEVSLQYSFKPVFPNLKLCGDNAAMIAMVGLEKFKNKQFDNLDLPANPRLSLDVNAKFLKGAGVEL